MKALNQLFTFLSSVIILTVFTFGVANANNENAMVAAKQFNAEEYAKAYAAITKAETAIAKSEAARAEEEVARAEEEAARAKAYAKARAKARAARAESIVETEEKAVRSESGSRFELKEGRKQ